MSDEHNELNASEPTPQDDEPKQKQAPDESVTDGPEPAFGWTSYAELINGRFAMIGFIALIILELFTHQSFFQWLFG